MDAAPVALGRTQWTRTLRALRSAAPLRSTGIGHSIYPVKMTPQPPPDGPRAFKNRIRSWVSKIRIRAWAWTAVVVVPLILAASFGSYFILAAPLPDQPPASISDQSPQDATRALQIARLYAEARRNALAAGGGFVAIAALILALRRQHHTERSTANTEDDALQRRITDARIRAVEQLGSDNPAVRIGGLHNLERIGQQHPELRQVVLDEICSYLRLPFVAAALDTKDLLPARQFEPVGPPPTEVTSDEAEREVRLIAQEILQRHLNPETDHLYWEHARLNLRNAHLEGVRLGDCHLTQADFSNATFTDGAYFRGATFTGDTSFRGATCINDAIFKSANFTGDASFLGARFTGDASFVGASFTDRAYFREAIFTGDVDFFSSTFGGDASFRAATFMSDGSFRGVTFDSDAYFGGATFTSAAHFGHATFTGDASFKSTTFNGHASFRGATCHRDVSFGGATFTSDTSFRSTRFNGDAHFWGTTLIGDGSFTTFADARFHGPLIRPTSTLVMLLRDQNMLLSLTAAHRLPEGWGLEPSTTDPGWGRPVRRLAGSLPRPEMRWLATPGRGTGEPLQAAASHQVMVWVRGPSSMSS